MSDLRSGIKLIDILRLLRQPIT